MPGDNAGPGFLKGEFLDHLNKLPKWEKTKYYCTSYKIYECKTGQTSNHFLREVKSRLQDKTILRKNESIQTEAPKTSINRLRLIKAEIFPIN